MRNISRGLAPFRPYRNLDTFFNQGLNQFWANDSFFEVPAFNIKELEDRYIVELSAPGLEKQDFSIEVKDQTLTIKVKKEKIENAEGDTSTGRYMKREFGYQQFTRSFQLDKTISTDDIQASYTDGILSVTLNKVTNAEIIRKVEIQ